MDGTMASKRHKPEEIVAKPRQVDVLTGQGNSQGGGRYVGQGASRAASVG